MLHASFEFPARKHEPATAGLTFHTDIGTNSQDGPLESATGMGLPHAKHIPNAELERTVRIDRHDEADLANYISPGIFIPPVRAPSLSVLSSVALVIAS